MNRTELKYDINEAFLDFDDDLDQLKEKVFALVDEFADSLLEDVDEINRHLDILTETNNTLKGKA